MLTARDLARERRASLRRQAKRRAAEDRAAGPSQPRGLRRFGDIRITRRLALSFADDYLPPDVSEVRG